MCIQWAPAERTAGVVVPQGFRRALGTAGARGAGGPVEGFGDYEEVHRALRRKAPEGAELSGLSLDKPER